MTKDEALKLALKFVEDSECGTADLEAHIKEALAQPDYKLTSDYWLMENAQNELERIKLVQTNVGMGKFADRDAAYSTKDRIDKFLQGEDYRGMYLKVRDELAALQQRTWPGLTDEDIEEVERWVKFKEEGSGRIPVGKLVRYIEVKLKEKNT